VKQVQRERKFVLPSAPLTRLARKILSDLGFEHRLSRGAERIICRSVEDHAMQLCYRLRELADHAGRTAVQPKDFVVLQKICPDDGILLPDFKELFCEVRKEKKKDKKKDKKKKDKVESESESDDDDEEEEEEEEDAEEEEEEGEEDDAKME